MFPLREYQERAVGEAERVLLSGARRLMVSPTGTGKGVCIAALIKRMAGRGMIQVVPSIEIALSIFEKHSGEGLVGLSEARQREATEALGMYTAKRLYNLLMEGKVAPPKMLSTDESHHDTDATHSTIRAVCGDPPMVGWTATDYRGTPEETAKLRALWGESYHVLRLHEAVAQGFMAKPDFRVWPLLNDEKLRVTAGEFEIRQTESELEKVSDELCRRIRDEFCTIFDPDPGERGSSFCYMPRRVMMLTCPGVGSAKDLSQRLWKRYSVPTVLVTGGECVTGSGQTVSRQTAFAYVTSRQSVLVQVNVVSEGVDLPIRVHIDTAPTMSPLRWMQKMGRGTRPTAPGEEPPVYVCTNHNLGRSAYLWAGLIPAAQIKDAQTVWGPAFKPSRRMFSRAIGLEGFGKFAVAQVPLVDGSFAGLYALQTPDGVHQYAILLHPCRPDPLFFQRTNPHTGEIRSKTLDNGMTVQYKVKDYGPWRKIPSIPDAEGYVSTSPGKITDPMLRFWRNAAAGRGLDPEFLPNVREFQALPILCNTGIRFTLEAP